MLFLLFVFRHYGYQSWATEQQGVVFGAAAAVCIIVLLISRPVWLPLKAWIIGEEVLSVGCYSLWLVWPEWFVHEFSDEKCSQAVGFKLGSVGLVVVALLAYRTLTLARVDDGLDRKGSGK